jgi:hypothetical protein
MQALKQPIYYIVLMLFSFATKAQPLPTFNNVGKFNCVGEQEKYRNYRAFFFTRNCYYSFVELGANLFKSKIDGEDLRIESYDASTRKVNSIKLPAEFLNSKFEYLGSHYDDNNLNVYLHHYNKEQKLNFIFCFCLNEKGDGLVASKVLDYPSAKKDKFENLSVKINPIDNTASFTASYTINDNTSASAARCKIGGTILQNFVTAPIPQLSASNLTQVFMVGDNVFFSFFSNPTHNGNFNTIMLWPKENMEYATIAVASKSAYKTKNVSFATKHAMPYFFGDKSNNIRMATTSGENNTTVELYILDEKLDYTKTSTIDLDSKYSAISGKNIKGPYSAYGNGSKLVTQVEQTKHGEILLTMASVLEFMVTNGLSTSTPQPHYHVGPILIVELNEDMTNVKSTCGINYTHRLTTNYNHFVDPQIYHGADKKSWYPLFQGGSYFDRSNEIFTIPQDKSVMSKAYANSGYAYSSGENEVITRYHVLNDRMLRIKHNKLFVDIATASF